MYNNILHNLLICSVSGSIMLLLSLFARAFLKNRSFDYYLMLITSAVMFLFPFSSFFELPKAVTVEIQRNSPMHSIICGSADTAAAQPSLLHMLGLSEIIFIIWASAAAVMLVKNMIRYAILLREIKAECKRAEDKNIEDVYDSITENMLIRPRLMRCSKLSSPILFGIISPMLILPECKFSTSDLRMIITHEIMHYRHKDIIIKQLALLAVCLHWYNPAVYILRRKISEACELYCDETVLRKLKPADKKDYGRLLLSVMEHSVTGTSTYSTSMSASKKSIKSRLVRIVEFKEATKLAKAIGLLTAVSVTVCSLTAFGFSQAAEIVPESVAPIFKAPAAAENPTEEAPTENPTEHPTEKPTENPTESPSDETVEKTSLTYESAAETIYEAAEEEPENTVRYTLTSDEYNAIEPDTTMQPDEIFNSVVLSKGTSIVLNADFTDGDYRIPLIVGEETYIRIVTPYCDGITLYKNGTVMSATRHGMTFTGYEDAAYELVMSRPQEYNGDKIYIYCE